ncbi:ABC transporter ATP-binding protein [Nitrincola sp.]|uniref:ABC transporter ATP-binding protein n=1 Tax=Nitrincola sp. TaxID=1926584 RepID=UPI003A91DFE7
MKDLLLEVDALSVYAGETRLLEPLSCTLTASQPLTILGQTGAGKSLLAQAIMGLLPEALSVRGDVRLNGKSLFSLSISERQALWGRVLSMLPQEPWHALDPVMQVKRQVAEVHHYVLGQEQDAAEVLAEQALQRLGLEGALAKIPSQLSGGMAQRVAFVAATAAGGQLLLADEPTKGLDYGRRDQVVALLQSQLDQGALLTITHDIDVARQLGGDLIVMRRGQVMERGRVESVLANPQSDYTRELLAADPQSWTQVKQPLPAAAPLVRVEGLGKSRGGKPLFDDVSFELYPHQLTGLVGDSGCGKSTLGDLLLGNLKPDQGKVSYQRPFARHQLLKLYQDPPAAFAPGVTLQQLLMDLVKLHRLDASRIPPLLERLHLNPQLLQRSCTEVSGGELQRISLLRALLMDPVLLFADEPTSRLDPITSQQIIELLVEVAQDFACSVVLVSHDPVLVEKTCHQVIAL